MKLVIGDIHGEIKKLSDLVNFILKSHSNPQFIFIGDYLDKGENVKETLNFLMEIQQNYE